MAYRYILLALVVAASASGWREARADVPYKAEIVGAKPDGLAGLLDAVSQLKSLADRPPVTKEALRRRAERDLKRLADAAHSLGYWSARFAYKIDTNAKPAKVTVTVTPGPLYRVASITVLGADGKPLAVPRGKDAPPLPLKAGDPARSAPVVALESALLAAFANHGHPFAKAEHRRVVIDQSAHTMTVTYRIAPGPVMRFGPPAIEGLKHLSPGYVENRLRWHEGELYDARKVAESRRALIESGLFATVSITPKESAGRPGRVRMVVAASERLRRTIGVGVAYNTSEGAGIRAFWENRDLFGHAERLKLGAGIGQQKTDATIEFRRPDFVSVDQDFLANAGISDESPTAYHSRRAQVSTGLERRFTPQMAGGAGLNFEKANVVQLANLPGAPLNEHYGLISAPAYLKLDTTDNLLNPTRGYRAAFGLTPYQSFSGPDLTFVLGRASASTYRRLGSDRLILAGRLALASIAGDDLVAIPADKRIYAGGGGSIRAYGYQMAGPLDLNKKPLGGKSSFEVSLELRIRITDEIGVVPFVDAGSFYEKSLPQLGSRMLWGPGLGLRYYSPVGPIRLDVATPAVRRHGDSPIQLYISLGQAF